MRRRSNPRHDKLQDTHREDLLVSMRFPAVLGRPGFSDFWISPPAPCGVDSARWNNPGGLYDSQIQ